MPSGSAAPAPALTDADMPLRSDRVVAYTRDELVTYSPVTEPAAARGGMRIDELCAAAVTLSDNTAANVLLRDLAVLGLCVLVVRQIYRPELDLVRAGGADDPAGGIFDGAPDAPPRWLPGRLRPKAPRAVEPAPTDLDYFEDAVAR